MGNCASALVQGIQYYREHDTTVGLLYPEIGGYQVTDVVPVAAFDVDARKVGKDLAVAINEAPNCTMRFQDVPNLGVQVQMGPRADGVPTHLERFVTVAADAPVDVAAVLRQTKADLVINLLPTGSARASRAYADAALSTAKIGFINGIPELIASDAVYSELAKRNGVVLVGDDFKSQVGTTILHRSLIQTCLERGVRIDRMYQYNYAGNTDFANLERRGESKEITKHSALQSLLPYEVVWGLAPMFIEGQEDIKTGKINIIGRYWAGNEVRIQLELQVNDSADAAGVMIDMIRFAKVATERGLSGVIEPLCAYYAKHPPVQMADDEAKRALDQMANWEEQKFLKVRGSGG